MNRYCLYQHKRLDTNEVFYIGIGSNKRPYTKSKRNNHWKNIVNKHGYTVEIINTNLTLEEARKLEISLISFYGRQNNKTGILVNMTDGGEGTKGFVCTEEMRLRRAKQLSICNLGRKKSEEQKRNMKLNSGKSKKVVCTITNRIWNSIIDCANENNLKGITLSQYLRGTRNNKTTFKFLSYE